MERFSSCLANPFFSRVERVIPILMAAWSDAWDLVRGRVADAFDLIRQEVQLAAAEEEAAE